MAVLLALLIWLTNFRLAYAEYQQCSPSSTCTIGEFLFDDDYQPDTGAACTLTAQYPNGTSFLNAASATEGTEGWYYYTATIGTTTGLYPANLCCTSGTDYLCIDKSFEVVAAAASPLSAASVWTYSDRKLTGFDNLIADIWNNSNRSLTTFGDLVSNVWNYSTTTTTDPEILTQIINEQAQQRELLEQLVNAPIISMSLEDGNIPDLNTKLEQSQIHAADLLNLVKTAQNKIGDRSAIAIMFDQPEPLAFLTKAWDAPAIDRLIEAVAAVKRSLTREALENLEYHVSQIPAFLEEIKTRNTALMEEEQRLAGLFGANQDEIDAAKTRVLTLNQFPGGAGIITPVKTSQDQALSLKNLIFNLQALLGLNRQLLAYDAGSPVRSVWLTEGSIIFRGVITNPSTVITQTVPFKFYLPREIKPEHIIALDPALESTFDPTEDALYVSGEFSVGPDSSKLVFVEVEDVWQLTDEEISIYRNQAAELIKPLAKTSYYAQGTVLKTEIDATLDKVRLNFNKTVSPESRIRTFREAQLDLNRVKTNLARLQDLVAQASGTGSIFGFVGGVQAIAVWGILIIVLASFVFLTMYMRQLRLRPAPVGRTNQIVNLPAAAPAESFWANPAVVPILILVTVITTVVIAQMVMRPKPAAAPAIVETKVAPPPASPSSQPQPINIKEEKQVLGTQAQTLRVPKAGSINIRSGPASDAPIVMTMRSTVIVYVFEQQSGWKRIGLEAVDSGQELWVSGELVD